MKRFVVNWIEVINSFLLRSFSFSSPFSPSLFLSRQTHSKPCILSFRREKENQKNLESQFAIVKASLI